MDEDAKLVPVAYITKYCLTGGIWEVRGAEDVDGYLSVRQQGLRLWVSKAEWFPTLAEAQERAQEKVTAKWNSLFRSMKKLEKLLNEGKVKVVPKP